MAENKKIIRERVLQLIAEKETLEYELAELNKILVANKVGMNDPLVDDEGFPLPHVDIYQVRHARHLIICKQNDYKKLLKEIEDGVAEYYDHSRYYPETETITSVETVESIAPSTSVTSEIIKPFAKINIVHKGSPADQAGIHQNDLVIAFGSVNTNNYRSLKDIGNVIQYSKGNLIIIKILRGERIISLRLLPREWNGKGLLGCNILPM